MIDANITKLLTDAGAVTILALALLAIVVTIGRLVKSFIGVMNDYVAALKESNKQTALFRRAITKMDERHSKLLVGNNSIVHLTYERVGQLETTIVTQMDGIRRLMQSHEDDRAKRAREIIAAINHEPLPIQPSNEEKTTDEAENTATEP